MRQARKFWLTSALCVAVFIATGLVAVRHRHEGDRFHTHSGHTHSTVTQYSGERHSQNHGHSHGHSHSHGPGQHHGHGHTHGHTHPSNAAESEDLSDVHAGWHVHLMLFGWEITFWEQGVQILRVPSLSATQAEQNLAEQTTFSRGSVQINSGGLDGGAFPFVLAVLLLPLRRIVCPLEMRCGSYLEPLFRRGRHRDPPPSPPPRNSEALSFR